MTKSKVDSTHNRRTVFAYLKSKAAVTELFREVAVKVGDRPGGYTRIIKTGNRLGDNAEMAMIELVDFNEVYGADKVAKKGTRRGRKKADVVAEAVVAAPVVEAAAVEETPVLEAPVVDEAASSEEAPDATMLVHLIQYNRSDIEASAKDHNISKIKVRNEGNAFGTADFYELLVRDGKDAGAYYDFRALGAQYFSLGSETLVDMAMNAHNNFNNGAEIEYDIYIDTTGDGEPDFAVFALDYGLVYEGYTDGHMGVFVYNLGTGDLWAYEGSAPLDGSTVFMPMLASDLGLHAENQVANIVAIETYSVYNDGLSDFNLTNATFNPINPQRSTGDWLEMMPDTRDVVYVGSREPGENEIRSLGWMVVAQNNRSGGSQADLIREHHDEDDDH